eukprot:TRINITY_DN1836_c0_g3_i1.p1 TRINITY_DN1836_c0_g3~~TRINITY_DN1836_c0_g3_i1.p1  ORF type:complete len:155 (+),score=26.51 TRINITY_DN1836_c0_g3_i1:62-466(+)
MTTHWSDMADSVDEAWVEMGLLFFITWMGMSSIRIMRRAFDAAKEVQMELLGNNRAAKPTTSSTKQKKPKKTLPRNWKKKRVFKALATRRTTVVTQSTQTESPFCSPPLSPRCKWNEPEYVIINELDMSCVPPV